MVEILKHGVRVHPHDMHFRFGHFKALLALDAMPSIERFLVHRSGQLDSRYQTYAGPVTGQPVVVSIEYGFCKRGSRIDRPYLIVQDTGGYVPFKFGIEKATALFELRDELRQWASQFGLRRSSRVAGAAF